MARRLEAAGFPFGDSVVGTPKDQASISTSSSGSPATVTRATTRPRSGSTTTVATVSSSKPISARTAFKIPGALLVAQPEQVSKRVVPNRTAYKVPGALLLAQPEEEMPINSKKAAKSFGRALAKPFTAGMSAGGGEFTMPVSINAPGDARGRAFGDAPEKSEKGKEKEKDREKDKQNQAQSEPQTPSTQLPSERESPWKPAKKYSWKSEKESPNEVLRTPHHLPAPASAQRQGSPLLGLQIPSDNTRPESGLLPDPLPVPTGLTYHNEKHAIMTSPALRPVDAIDTARRTERWADRMYPDSKHSSGSQPRSADDTEDHIRQLFNALPPEAQALAFARLADQREREAQLAAMRDRERQWERDAEARFEREWRENERARMERARGEMRRAPSVHGHHDYHAAYDGIHRDHNEAYDGMYRPFVRRLPVPGPLPLAQRQPMGEPRGPRRQGSEHHRNHQPPPHRRVSPTSAQEDLEAQIAQLLEAHTLPPLPDIPRRDSGGGSGANSPARRPSTRGGRWTSTAPSAPPAHPIGPAPSVPRALSDPLVPAPRSALPPRPAHGSSHGSPFAGAPLVMSPAAVPVDLAAPLPQPSTPRSKAAGGDSEVRDALAAKIRALQAALDTLDVADDDDDVSSVANESPSIRPHSGVIASLDLFSRPQAHATGHRRGTSDVRDLDPQTPRLVAPVTPRDVLNLNRDLRAPRPRMARESPSPLALPTLHLPEETGDDSVPSSRPSSELGADDDFHLGIEDDRRGMARRTPPPEYATFGPDF